MRARTRILVVFLPAVLALAMLVRSYWRFDFAGARGWHMGSEFGAVYVFYTGGGAAYVASGPAGENGRLEVETGTVAIPLLAVRTWSNNGDRYWVVQWWAIAAAAAGVAWWAWRRRRLDGTRGFEVAATAGTNR